MGQSTMANSTPVAIASNQTPVPVTAVSLPLPTGAATEATLSALNTKVTAVNTGAVIVSSSALPSGAATESTLSTRLADATFTGRINTQGQKLMADSTPVVLASDQTAVPISAASLPLPTGSATSANQITANSSLSTIATNTGNIPSPSTTGTTTSVAASASDVTILASNASRKGATIFNDSNYTLYLLVAAGVSTITNYTVQMSGNDYFEIPFEYTGIIKGLWASATGSARVTEYT